MIFSLDYPSKSIFTPALSVKMLSENISDSLLHSLREIVLKEEPNIIKNVPPANENDPDWMTGRLWKYNFLNLDYDEIRQLKQWISDKHKGYVTSLGYTPPKVYIQCWVNILRNNGRRIIPHHHADGHSDTPNAPQEYAYLSGNLCIQTNETSTWFQNPFLNQQVHAIPNKDGECIFFPSWVVHWTDVNKSDVPRITISFDIITEEFYNIIDGKNYMEL